MKVQTLKNGIKRLLKASKEYQEFKIKDINSGKIYWSKGKILAKNTCYNSYYDLEYSRINITDLDKNGVFEYSEIW